MKLLATVLTLCVLVCGFETIQAHVLLSDSEGKVGSILHITPDDDPIAGEPSNLFFDIQDRKVTEKTHSFTVKIIAEDGAEALAPINISGSNINASYTFPRQGAYSIVLSAEPTDTNNRALYFKQAQRISRGVAGDQPVQTHVWAEMGIVASCSALIALGIVAFNKRALLAATIRKSK